MNTEKWIDFILRETGNTLTVYYYFMAFFDNIKEQPVLDAVNKNLSFWRVHTATLQISLYINLNRLSDDSKDGKSFSDFQKHCISNINDFSKLEFVRRKPNILDINPQYFDGVIFPTETDIKNLFSLMKSHNEFLRAECKTIRSKVFAHAIYTENHETDHLFKKAELPKIEAALLAMSSIAEHLWQSFHNANTINPLIISYRYKNDIYDASRKAITGAI
jgi:hypothetical protein